ncbi:preprotein translocase subunit YajC [candidate division WOR-3 bacterium]|uniref:Preprotein translocase subunit YajC n=1 Tax=candidate division WOR-3 bacterium TaxID=2052148 RepID=A0A660SGG3_UNCW3|nr:MAG: preprotein translocase subunit YajC [candidate division WOR-3 bacterium]
MNPLYGADGGQANPIGAFLPLILIFVIFYFLLFYPQQKRQKEHQRLVASLKKGDNVITSSGIHGTIAAVKDRTVSLIISEGVKIEVDKDHIVTVKGRK